MSNAGRIPAALPASFTMTSVLAPATVRKVVCESSFVDLDARERLSRACEMIEELVLGAEMARARTAVQEAVQASARTLQFTSIICAPLAKGASK